MLNDEYINFISAPGKKKLQPLRQQPFNKYNVNHSSEINWDLIVYIIYHYTQRSNITKLKHLNQPPPRYINHNEEQKEKYNNRIKLKNIQLHNNKSNANIKQHHSYIKSNQLSKISIQSKHKMNVEQKNDNNSNSNGIVKESKEMCRSKSVIEVINKDKIVPQQTQMDIRTLLLKYWLKLQLYSMIKIALIVKILHDKKHKIRTKTTNSNANTKSKYSKHKLFYIKLYNIIKINVYKTILSSLSHKLNIKRD